MTSVLVMLHNHILSISLARRHQLGSSRELVLIPTLRLGDLV